MVIGSCLVGNPLDVALLLPKYIWINGTSAKTMALNKIVLAALKIAVRVPAFRSEERLSGCLKPKEDSPSLRHQGFPKTGYKKEHKHIAMTCYSKEFLQSYYVVKIMERYHLKFR